MVVTFFRNVLTVSLFFFGIPTFCSSAIMYVDQDATNLNDGSYWVNVFTNFQDGLSAAVAGVHPAKAYFLSLSLYIG